ncbi:MAG: hypothetical protein AAGK33_13545 [Pseudomonadota bacterium]
MANDNIQSIEDFDPDAPPFAEFRDWCTVPGVDDPWEYWKDGDWRTKKQVAIVEANINYLEDKSALQKRFNCLRTALEGIPNAAARQEVQELYCFDVSGTRTDQRDLDLSTLTIPCDVKLHRVSVTGTVALLNANFAGDISLDNSFIGDWVWLQSVTVGGNVSLDGTEVGARLRLDQAKLDGNLSLDGVRVGDELLLINTEVQGDIWLDQAKIGGDARFVGLKVGEDIWLHRAKVMGNLLISSTNLRNNATLLASNMQVKGNLSIHLKHNGGFKCQRLSVYGTSIFSGSRFEQVPDFRNAMFERPPEVADMKVPLPAMKRTSLFCFATAKDSDDVARFRKLKAMALAANDHEKDGEFFAKEMIAKRGIETTTFFGLLFNSLYWTLSNFGQSFMRPMAWLGASLAFFTALYAALATTALGFSKALEFGAIHAIKNLTPVVSTIVRFGAKPKDYVSVYDKRFDALVTNDAPVGWIIVLSYGQAFIGTVLLFLLLLALRNKFRLK